MEKTHRYKPIEKNKVKLYVFSCSVNNIRKCIYLEKYDRASFALFATLAKDMLSNRNNIWKRNCFIFLLFRIALTVLDRITTHLIPTFFRNVE